MVALAACQPAAPPSLFKSIDITGATYARDFNLPDAHGAARSLAEFKGKVVLLFFGFTQCPDVCPTALGRALEARQLLGADADKLQVVFVSVDPERDTPEVLREYMKAFDPSFIALRGNGDQVAAMAKEFKVFFQKVPTTSSYTMDHTTATYAFDPKGRIRLAIRKSAICPGSGRRCTEPTARLRLALRSSPSHDPKDNKTMNPQRRLLNLSLTSSLLLPGLATAANDHSADGPYATLDRPFPTDSPGKIEVLEFLWYGCPHCAKVEPFVEAWAKKLPADVVFRREHIVWESRADTVAHARLFATLKAMNLLSTHQQAVFAAVHNERADFKKEAVLAEWVGKRGIDRAAFDAMHKSFGVQSQVGRMKGLTNTYKVESVPTFFVNGKYITEPHRAGGEQQVLAIIDKLITQERALPKR